MADMLTYHIVPENLAEHVFNVKLSIPASRHNVIHLSLPAWIPGSYMIRDFSKNIHSIEAVSPNKKKSSIRQLDKQTWQVENAALGLELTYQVYAFDLSVRGAYLFDEYAFFNGTSTFLEVKEFTENSSLPILVNIVNNQLANGWQLCTSLTKQTVKELAGNATHSFICEDYQELIDHPVLMGVVQKHTFEVCGVRFHFVLSGNNETDVERICNDLKPLCKHHLDLFGGIPEKDYWFITLLCEDGFGGLEHRASTALMFPRFDLPMRCEELVITEQYQQFLSLCSHEFFHAWNVKRIKPELMIAPDLRAEQYMEQLWIYEGFTSLYDDLSLARTKIISAQRYAEILGENVTRLNRAQGRHKQTITQSSFDAWTKFYKQDAGSHNHIVSYYTKGAIIALALDISLRQLSGNRFSIDNVMQLLWSNYGVNNIGTPNDVIQTLCKTHFNIDISLFLDIAIYTSMDLPLDTLVQTIGLKLNLRSRSTPDDKGGKANKDTIKHAFGATYKDQGSGVMLQTMQDGSPIVQAGAQIGDVMIALGQWQVHAGNLQRLLDNQQTSTVDITILRQGRLIRSKLPIQTAINDTVYFTIENADVFDAWISGAVSP